MTDIAGEPQKRTDSAATDEADTRSTTPVPAASAEKGEKDSAKPKRHKKKPVDPASPATPRAAPRERKHHGKRRQDLNQALVFELRTLRASLAQTLESIELRLGGRITELLHGIEGDQGLDQKPKPLTVKEAQAALAEVGALRIKPKRGRVKDIRRIDRAIETLRELQRP